MKIYTRKGDKGETQLIGKRVGKTDARVEAYGTIDELNSFIGMAAHAANKKNTEDVFRDLLKIQHELFDLGGDLANVTKEREWVSKEKSVAYLEKEIDKFWEEAPPINSFILPGGVLTATHLHVCRTVTRRAERAVLKIDDGNDIPPIAIKYLNRLSDFFFAAARAVNARNNKDDILYRASNKRK